MTNKEAVLVLMFPDRYTLGESIMATTLAERALMIDDRRRELIKYYEKQIEEYPYDVQGIAAYGALMKCEVEHDK